MALLCAASIGNGHTIVAAQPLLLLLLLHSVQAQQWSSLIEKLFANRGGGNNGNNPNGGPPNGNGPTNRGHGGHGREGGNRGGERNIERRPDQEQGSNESGQGQGHFRHQNHRSLSDEKPEPIPDVQSGLNEWQKFVKKHKPWRRHRQDDPMNEDQQITRMTRWKNNRDKISEHNQKFNVGNSPFTLKLGPLADLLPEEVTQLLNGAKPPPDDVARVSHINSKRRRKRGTPPPSLDYRNLPGYLTPVKDQGGCGCCWAIASAGALEGQLYGYYGRTVSLSSQQLIDCARNGNNNGCSGGWPMYAFDYVKDNGIMMESKYPFSEQDTQQCFSNSRVPSVRITGGEYLPEGDEEELKQALYDVGPIAVCINADSFEFQQYSQGVYKDDSCSKNVNHAVLLVGYGTDADTGLDYWILKNSWNSDWGDGGYIKLARNNNNQCGIASWGQYPLFE